MRVGKVEAVQSTLLNDKGDKKNLSEARGIKYSKNIFVKLQRYQIICYLLEPDKLCLDQLAFLSNTVHYLIG